MSLYARLIRYLRPYRTVFLASLIAMAFGSLFDGFDTSLLGASFAPGVKRVKPGEDCFRRSSLP